MRFLDESILLAVVTLSVNTVTAATIHVPADSSTIQAGILGAVDCDTVLVADGIYSGDGNRDIDFLGKKIVVMSENGPESCIVDCEGSVSNPHRGFYFHIKEDENSVLSGFTILNGYTLNYGGGIYCFNCSPIIEGNRITGNTTVGKGGGIYCSWDYIPPTTLRNNIIQENVADCGGGIACDNYSRAVIESNTIIDNTADDGGGIYGTYFSDLDIVDNLIMENTGTNGGGIFLDGYSEGDIRYNTVMNNTGTGGGIYCYHASPFVAGNMIVANTANKRGGGMIFYSSSPAMTGNTVAGNIAGESGGGIYFDFSHPTLSNSILWGDAPDEIYLSSGELSITHSDIDGGWAGEGNIDEDPLFIDVGNGDFHLRLSSPCIDAGDPGYYQEPGEIDIDDQHRVLRGRIDMGADEVPFPNHTLPAMQR